MSLEVKKEGHQEPVDQSHTNHERRVGSMWKRVVFSLFKCRHSMRSKNTKICERKERMVIMTHINVLRQYSRYQSKYSNTLYQKTQKINSLVACY